MKKLIVFGLTLLLSAPVFAKPAQEIPTVKTKFKAVNIGITIDPITVSPLSMHNIMSYYASCILFMPLVSEMKEEDFIYRLAENIATEDNLIFTIALRRNVAWTDGMPVTADDVIFTMNAISNPAVGMPDPSAHRIIAGTDDAGLFPPGAEGISGVQKIDDYTITVETKYPVLLNVFKVDIGTMVRTMPKHILEAVDPGALIDHPFFQNPTVTNGAFRFKEYSRTQDLTLEANDAYFLGRPNIDTLRFKILSGNQIADQLVSGEIDMNYPGVGNIPVDAYSRILSTPHLHTMRGAPGTVQVVFYNNKVLDNLKVRQAMDMAIDRDGILQDVFLGQAFMTKTPVSSHIEFWNEDASKYAYDPEQAKQLLAESRWDTSRQLTFLVPTSDITRSQICTRIAENFRAVGLTVVIEPALFSAVMSRIEAHDYDIAIIGMPANHFTALRNLSYYADSKTGRTGYADLKMDQLLNTLLTNVDETILQAAYYEIQELLAEEVPVSGVYSELVLRAANKRLTFGTVRDFGTFRDLEQWDIVK
ncbi:MAG: ABC transporter substrate-binding protein [Spirochaetaceae bacterium]|nr:ABC transporter substrate-binding protein [Spirochaetaceae bacterium]